jgi:apolipoprotein N-acyltransferase
MIPLHPDDPDCEASEYANAAHSTAFRPFKQLAEEGPPKIPSTIGPISLSQLTSEAQPYEQYYNSLIVFDPQRAC